MGVYTKNTVRYVSVNQIRSSLGQLLSSAHCAFSNLPVELSSIEEEVSGIEHFICALYGKRKLDPVNDARFKFFAISTKRKMKISR